MKTIVWYKKNRWLLIAGVGLLQILLIFILLPIAAFILRLILDPMSQLSGPPLYALGLLVIGFFAPIALLVITILSGVLLDRLKYRRPYLIVSLGLLLFYTSFSGANFLYENVIKVYNYPYPKPLYLAWFMESALLLLNPVGYLIAYSITKNEKNLVIKSALVVIFSIGLLLLIKNLRVL